MAAYKPSKINQSALKKLQASEAAKAAQEKRADSISGKGSGKGNKDFDEFRAQNPHIQKSIYNKNATRREWRGDDAKRRYTEAVGSHEDRAKKFEKQRDVSEELRSRRGMSDLIASGEKGGKEYDYKEDTTSTMNKIGAPTAFDEGKFKQDYLMKNNSTYADLDASSKRELNRADYKDTADYQVFGKPRPGIGKNLKPYQQGNSGQELYDAAIAQQAQDKTDMGTISNRYGDNPSAPKKAYRNGIVKARSSVSQKQREAGAYNTYLNDQYLNDRSKAKMGDWDAQIDKVKNQQFNENFIQDRDPSMSKRKFEKKKKKGAGAPQEGLTQASGSNSGLMNSVGSGLLS